MPKFFSRLFNRKTTSAKNRERDRDRLMYVLLACEVSLSSADEEIARLRRRYDNASWDGSADNSALASETSARLADLARHRASIEAIRVAVDTAVDNQAAA